MSRRRVMQGSVAAVAGGLLSVAASRARAGEPIRVISHRYPALELYAAKMRAALPGVTVDVQMMPFDKALELTTIALSGRSDAIDILYTTDITVLNFARNGWLRPLDDLWSRYQDELELGDFSDKVMRALSYQNHIYVMPHSVTVMLFFYRKDLFDAADKAPPGSIEEYLRLAGMFHNSRMAGTVSCLKPVDATLNEAHWYLNAIGDGWFDGGWKPAFNSSRGVQAIEMLKAVVANAQPGFTTYGNDECTIALQQGLGAMGLQWVTRARAMDDPTQSRVVGKIDWVPPPQGGGRFSTDGYAISAFSKQDPDTLFRIIATSANEANIREAVSMVMPPRRSLLGDPDLARATRFYPAALAALPASVPFPRLPDFYAAGEMISRRIQQAVTGQMAVKQALDAAAAETEGFLRQRGYYR